MALLLKLGCSSLKRAVLIGRDAVLADSTASLYSSSAVCFAAPLSLLNSLVALPVF